MTIGLVQGNGVIALRVELGPPVVSLLVLEVWSFFIDTVLETVGVYADDDECQDKEKDGPLPVQDAPLFGRAKVAEEGESAVFHRLLYSRSGINS